MRHLLPGLGAWRCMSVVTPTASSQQLVCCAASASLCCACCAHFIFAARPQERLPGAKPGGEPLPEGMLWLLLTGQASSYVRCRLWCECACCNANSRQREWAWCLCQPAWAGVAAFNLCGRCTWFYNLVSAWMEAPRRYLQLSRRTA